MAIGSTPWSKFLSKKTWRLSKSKAPHLPEIPITGDLRLPIELIEEILVAAWCPICPLELRRSFLSFFLVNRLWATLMKRIIRQYVRLDSGWAVLWYDDLYERYQLRTRHLQKPSSSSPSSSSKRPAKDDKDNGNNNDDENPRELCRDLALNCTPRLGGNMITTVVKTDFIRIIPHCSGLESAEFNFANLHIDPPVIAEALYQLTKLTHLHITSLTPPSGHAPPIPVVDNPSRLVKVRNLTLNVLSAQLTVGLIKMCPGLRYLALESSLEGLEGLVSYIPRLDKPSQGRNARECLCTIRPVYDAQDEDLRARAGLCISNLAALVPLLL